MTGKTTIKKIGSNNVEVKTFGTESIRIYLLLAISENEYKLKLLLKLKTKFNSPKKNLNNIDIAASYNLYVVS